MSPVKYAWFAAYTRSRAEKKVACELQKLGIEHYLPLVKTLRQWSDRKRKVEEPLIRSYVFVRITGKQHYHVLNTPGIVKIVCFSGKPVPVPDWQIENLKIIMGAQVSVTHETGKFEKGQEVIISRGNLQGLRGTIIRTGKQHKLVISIIALNYNMTVDISPSFVEPVAEQ